MPSRAVLLAPGVICLFVAFVLSLLVSISLPTLPALDIARTDFDTSFFEDGNIPTKGVIVLGQVRLGIWAYCGYDTDGHGYTVRLPYFKAGDVPANPEVDVATISSSWTRGLAIHPVATAVIGIAFILSLSTNLAIELTSSIVSLLAVLITLLAFVVDIALYVNAKHVMSVVTGTKTVTAPGFWLTFTSLIMLLIESFTICIGRRRRAKEGPSADSKGIRLAFWRR
ncbi:uncharacterized protein STEHIDRAFT_155056 [Stereum hirsutum FP-91666 SS1]|uniref:uncharacterized protein n=1 Tax=Stereum hirsutum (strain FP-91666) TaxID=721885 RepID=UPI000440EDA9|nr:uncharacterized protein STEHIDRAFT_155056 [Stereum hirsutum FP-91666 SS1]EIM89388.1 hypothetical protein STEHIDRAFT_155056 [Stereum hirsutum FP-91666 SS1]